MTMLVAIVGITGNQAGATAKSLLERKVQVRGITRDVESPEANTWKSQHVTLISGGMNDPLSLQKAFEGVDCVYFATPGVGDEVAMGQNVVNAAKAAGVKHIVFSSVAIADRADTVPLWHTKWLIEQYIHSSGIPWTVLRPMVFMDMYLPGGHFAIEDDKIAGVLPSNRKTQYIAVDSIGYVAAETIVKRDKYLGQTIELAADFLDGNEMANVLSRANGRKFQYSELPVNEYMKQIVNFRQTHEDPADIPKLRLEFPGMLTWEQFVRTHNLGK